VVIVLTCVGALAVELGLFIATENNPGGTDTTIARVGIVTSLICAASGFAGLTRRPTLAIPELGVALGILGLVIFIGLEAVSRACFVCF
jgi:hypothetical protein